MTAEQKEKTKEFTKRLLDLCQQLHKRQLNDNTNLYVYRMDGTRMVVEFFKIQGYSQSLLGRLGVMEPRSESDPICCDGFYNHYDNEFQQKPNLIKIIAETPEEAFEKMSNCLAPLLDINDLKSCRFFN